MSWLFAPIYDRVMAQTEEACLRSWRAELLARATGDVVEIGAGTGANIELYPSEVSSVTFCEPDEGMRKRLEQKLAAEPPVYTYRVVDAAGESLPFEDACFDTLVSTLVLCTVRSPSGTLQELHRVAKPGAELLFIEHVAADEGTTRRFFQGLSEPVWKRVAGNCHLTRDTASAIAKEFRVGQLTSESMRKAISLVRPTIRGYAVADS